MDIQQLEEKLSRRPHSPLFPRIANAYLSAGRVEEACALAGRGASYTSYASVYLIQAKCLAAKEDYVTALVRLHDAMSIVPDSTYLQKLSAEWKAKAVQQTVSGSNTVATVEEKHQSSPGSNFIDLPEVVNERSQRVLGVALEKEEVRSGLPEASVAQKIPKEISTEITYIPPPVRQPVKVSAAVSEISPLTPVRLSSVIEEGRIVSRTLAEIYATQGQFEEAIVTYKLLERKYPERNQEFDLRIKELEQKLRSKVM